MSKIIEFPVTDRFKKLQQLTPAAQADILREADHNGIYSRDSRASLQQNLLRYCALCDTALKEQSQGI